MLDQVFIVVGAPGSGKDTACDVAKKLGIEVLSTSKLLEDHGKLEIIQDAVLAPDDLVCELLINRLSQTNGVVIINTLRSTRQCEFVWRFLAHDVGTSITTIHIDVAMDIAMERMMSRGRKDDQKAAKRIEDYSAYGPDVLEWLKHNTSFARLNGELPEPDVAQRMENLLKLEMSSLQKIHVPPIIQKWRPLTI